MGNISAIPKSLKIHPNYFQNIPVDFNHSYILTRFNKNYYSLLYNK